MQHLPGLKNGKSYDLILDVKANSSIIDYTLILSLNGIYVIIGGSMVRLFQALFLMPFISMFLKKHIRFVALKPNKVLQYMNKLFFNGKIKPLIDGPYKLTDVPKSVRLFGDGVYKGKKVINVECN